MVHLFLRGRRTVAVYYRAKQGRGLIFMKVVKDSDDTKTIQMTMEKVATVL